MSPEQLKLNGIMRVADYQDVLPQPRDFELVQEALTIMAQSPSEENPHAGASVFMVTMPEDKTYVDLSDPELRERKFTQHYYAKVLSKVLHVGYGITRPITFRVDKATASDVALAEQEDALYRYVERNKPGAIIMKDVELNLKNSRGEDILDSKGNPMPDDKANARLSELTGFLAEMRPEQNHKLRLPIFRLLPQEYYVTDPTPEDLAAITEYDIDHDVDARTAVKHGRASAGRTGAIGLREVVLL